MPPRLPDSQDTTPSNGPRGRPITSALLSAAPLVKVDKSCVLKSYLTSQRSYRTYFVQEGQKDWVSFDKPADNQSAAGDEEEKKRDGQDAGFATPTLKARVPASAKNVDKARQRSGVARERDTSRNTSQRAEEKIRRRGGASKKEKTEENQIANRRRKLEDYLLSQHQSAKKSSRKRQRSVESEREARTCP